MANNREQLFKRLTKIFRQGTLVKSKVKGFQDQNVKSSAFDIFRKSSATVYGNALNAYGQYDRLCIHGDTKIPVPGKERFVTISELVRRHGGTDERFIVYSYDHENKKVTPAWAHHPRSSGVKKVVKVTFDNGKSLICTEDHPCMLRDGTYQDAGTLKSKTSMMPFYRKEFDGEKNKKKFIGYSSILSFDKYGHNGWSSEHKMIAEWFYGRKKRKNEHIHHDDFCSLNNAPKNLVFMDAKKHLAMHGQMASNQWKDPIIREKMIIGLKKNWRKNNSRKENLISFNKSKKIKDKRRNHALKNNPTLKKEVRDKISESRKKYFKSEENRKKHSECIINAHKNGKIKVSKNFINFWQDKNRRDNCSLLSLDRIIEYSKQYKKPKVKDVSKDLGVSWDSLSRFLKKHGYSGWREFKNIHLENHKVVSVEDYGHCEVFDLTVDGHENFATDSIFVHNSRYADFCFRGDTLVYTTRGIFSIKELAEKHKDGGIFHVYSYDQENKQIVIAEAHSARMTKNNEKQNLVKVNFEGGSVTVTPDHKFMTRDGNPCLAKDLRSGIALMPFSVKKIGNDYKWIYTMNKSTAGGWTQEHKMVAEYFDRPLKSNEVVHHKNFTPSNNLIENLQIMDEYEHKRYHAMLNNEKHSRWMKKNNPSKRNDITFERILEIAIETDFVSKKVQEILKVDQNVIKRRLREFGFKNWIDFKSKRKDIQHIISHNLVVKETRSPKIEEILEFGTNCKNIYELSQKLSCSPNSIRRRLESCGYGTWTDFKKPNGYDVIEGTGRIALIDDSTSYQDICNAYMIGMTYRELANAANTTANKVLATIKKEGFKSYTEWKEQYSNHKVISVEFLKEKDYVYNVTVPKYHNLAVGSGSKYDDYNKFTDSQDVDFIIVFQSEMEYTPEIASALDIYADETVAKDEKGRSLHVYSENPKIQELLDELFRDILTFDFAARSWVRNLCKYGDFFLLTDVSPKYGVINAHPIPVNEIEREEGFDPENPFAVRFRWTTEGNQTLEAWQVIHFRLRGNDTFLPYGSSILESGRRIWRQLILAEDAMLVYRVIRAPERRVFYIDVANAPANEVPHIVESARATLKTQQVVDNEAGRVDKRYNAWSVDIDYFIPVRGNETATRVDSLPGGQNTTAIDDVEYIQRKLFAALKVPKAYLQFDEGIAGKANLAQEDIRFARTIQQIQEVIVTELNKLAAIHLYAHNFRGKDLLNFTLQLSNPSTMAQQQKLELLRTRLEIMSVRPEGKLSDYWFYKEVFGMTDERIEEMEEEQVRELIRQSKLDQIGTAASEGGGFGGGGAPGGGLDLNLGSADGLELDGVDGGDGEGGDEFGLGDEGGEGDIDGDDEEDLEGEDLFASEDRIGPLIKDHEDQVLEFELDEDEMYKPIHQQSQIARYKHNNMRPSRLKHKGSNGLKEPNPGDALDHDDEHFKDIYGNRTFKGSPFKEDYERTRLSKETLHILKSLPVDINGIDFNHSNNKADGLISENNSSEVDDDEA